MARKPAVTHGFVVVDKPAGMTSHDVVGRLRRRFNERRVGHSGTLDPDATGVLLVAIGNATRLLQFFGNLPKTYTGEVVFGTATTTLDASGEVVATSDMSTLTIERVREASRRFVGDIMQVPPMVSALKVDGRRLHEIAREGGEVEREPRQVTVHRYVVLDEVERVDGNPIVSIEVTCSSGTYIRTLAADLGAALGGVAHLRNLRRRAIGDFVVTATHDAASIDTSPLMSAVATLAHLDGESIAMVSVGDEDAVKVRNGRQFDSLGGLDGRVGETRIVLNQRNELLAVYRRNDQSWKPEVVLPAALA
ncbi:MAG: tRNA pseudouridine(55) synthase TruB [Acidimicrobiia bacterium]|nr:tRNA pseudouridine(55) synthase TruB [Actinomycetota bacterium]NDG77108.1 tRNA pseudouridine(55) synthase TruB [Acidimicrobiia bacterium]